jgi:hypothetical protein
VGPAHRRAGRRSERCIEPAPNRLSRRTDELSAIPRNLFQCPLVKPWDRCQFGFVCEQQPLGGIDAAQNKRLDARMAETTCCEHDAGSEQLFDFGNAEIVPAVTNVAHIRGFSVDAFNPILRLPPRRPKSPALGYPRFPEFGPLIEFARRLRLTYFMAALQREAAADEAEFTGRGAAPPGHR